MDKLLYINTIPDIRIKEMVSNTEDSDLDEETPYYPDPDEPHEENN